MNDAREMPPVVFLMGPTGAGKTELAVTLAQAGPFDIVSVDSAMIYRGMDIGTAKPDPETRARAPHRLIDIRDPAEAYSAAEFRADALAEIERSVARGRVPLLAGGTGLYFRALERGLADLPAADPAIRARLRGEARAGGSEALHARLAEVDPEAAARIHPRDPQRLVRALEVYEKTGRALTHWLADDSARTLPYRVVRMAIAPTERVVLHRRLAARFHRMLEAGLIEEVAALHARGDLSLEQPAMRVVGYRQVWRHLEGELDRAAMVEKAVTATRQLAKRQLTWLRRGADTRWFDSESPGVAARVLGFLRESRAFGA